MDEWPLCNRCGDTACPPIIEDGEIVCPDCAKVPPVIQAAPRRTRKSNWPKPAPAVPTVQEQPIRTTAPLPVRTSFAPDAQGPETIPVWEPPHKELPRCGCHKMTATFPVYPGEEAFSALFAEARALVATGHARIGLERLRAMVSPKLARTMAYWPWRDLVEASGFTITPGRSGHPVEVVLQ